MNIPLVIGALVISFFLMWGLLSILKTTLKTALIIALIVFGLQMLLGIMPQQVMKQVMEFIGGIGNWFQHWDTKNKPPSNFRDEQSLLWLIDLRLASPQIPNCLKQFPLSIIL